MKWLFCFAGLLFTAFGLIIGVSSTQAQPYPNRPIQLILPAPAGSIIDIPARMVADEMAKLLGQPVICVSKPGGGFTLGTDFVARSKKDGYTLAYTNSPAIVYSRILNPDTVPYDPDKDLEPLGFHASVVSGVAVQASAPWKDFGELLNYAKSNPGKLRVSTPGVGSTNHFQLEIVQSLTGAQFTHVPFKGGESVVTALLGGHVEVSFDATSKLTPHVEAGKMRILLLSVKTPQYPKVPTLRDLGYKQDLISSWFGMYGPAGLPEDVKNVLIPAIEKAMTHPDVKAKLEKVEFVVNYKPPAEQRKYAADEYESGLTLAKKLGLRK
jgi:tripartite-type tricarboxylate transporter receptor subunit TctC